MPTVGYLAPNPELWFQAYKGPYWTSGEVAAAGDGFHVVPEKYLVYVPPDHLRPATEAAMDIVAGLAPVTKANLLIRLADPWLTQGEDEHLVERGQRLLDYAESSHIQLARALHGGL